MEHTGESLSTFELNVTFICVVFPKTVKSSLLQHDDFGNLFIPPCRWLIDYVRTANTTTDSKNIGAVLSAVKQKSEIKCLAF